MAEPSYQMQYRCPNYYGDEVPDFEGRARWPFSDYWSNRTSRRQPGSV